jgi:hypothetical protein
MKVYVVAEPLVTAQKRRGQADHLCFCAEQLAFAYDDLPAHWQTYWLLGFPTNQAVWCCTWISMMVQPRVTATSMLDDLNVDGHGIATANGNRCGGFGALRHLTRRHGSKRGMNTMVVVPDGIRVEFLLHPAHRQTRQHEAPPLTK